MKPTLLLLHGALGSPATLRPLADALALELADEVKIKFLAFAGHGGLEVSEAAFTLPHFAAQVLDLLQTEAEPTHVFGYSMGGYAALLAAAQTPARFASITTLGTTLDWSSELVATATGFLNPTNIQHKFPAFGEQLRQRHAPADWEAVVKATARLIKAAGDTPLLQPERFATLSAPVQLLVGDADQDAGPAAMKALAAQLPNGRFEVLPNIPHPLERVNLKMLVEKIVFFIRAAQIKKAR